MWPGHLFRAAVVSALALSACARVSAQQPENSTSIPDPPATGTTSPYKLRTYVNRVQIPTLVLNRSWKPVVDLPASAFSVRLDSGKVFHPTYARAQGDDPLSLAVLIDASGTQPEITTNIADELAEVAKTQLHPSDRISIFAADCRMFRTALEIRAEPDRIRADVSRALTAVGKSNGANPAHCKDSFHLLDYTALMISQVKSLPGRRVALIVSGGREAQSASNLQAVSTLAAQYAVSVFGLRSRSVLLKAAVTFDPTGDLRYHRLSEDPFALLCAGNGGVVFEMEQNATHEGLLQFFADLRGRYILEFPKPDQGEPGLHSITVDVQNAKRYFVRIAGASWTGDDPSLQQDPTVLRSNPPRPRTALVVRWSHRNTRAGARPHCCPSSGRQAA